MGCARLSSTVRLSLMPTPRSTPDLHHMGLAAIQEARSERKKPARITCEDRKWGPELHEVKEFSCMCARNVSVPTVSE